ncbi:ATP-grasp domain-containing protein [Halorubrum sp. DTA98]|uniref:carboxylate--amine ligase n=1 Tax=Halorubrum sp. DTA98 TaxID=3402163 RepID=UPI003AAA2882
MVESSKRRPDAVVVPGIEAPSTVACLRSLGPRDVRTIVVSEDETTPGFASRYCDETVLAPDPADDLEGYGDLLLDLAHRPAVRTIVPVREPDVYLLAKHKDAFAEHVGTPWPDFDQLRTVQDRKRLFDVAREVGVGVPETRLLNEWDDWDREAVIKSRYTIVVSDDDDGASYPTVRYHTPGEAPDAETVIEEMGHEPLVQEYMSDPAEYAFFALFDHGSPVATFQHRQIRGYKYSGGPSAFREAVDIPDLEDAGLRLLDRLDWHGLAMVEFKRHDGEFKLMEINPRFWSSLPFSVAAGVDFPYQYHRLSTGEPVEDQSYDVGAAGHLLRGEVGYLYSLLTHDSPLAERPDAVRSAGTVLASIAMHPRFDYLTRDDPRPFVRDVRRTIGLGVQRRV